jgi:hypothetical protein
MHNVVTKAPVQMKSVAFSTTWNRTQMSELHRLPVTFMPIYVRDTLRLPLTKAASSLARKRTSIWETRLGMTPSNDTRTGWGSCNPTTLRMHWSDST